MIAYMDQQRLRAAEMEEVQHAIDCARRAQPAWAAQAAAERARLIGGIRLMLAERNTEIAQLTAAVSDRPLAEKIVSEVLPLLDACKFLQKNAARILRPKKFGAAGRPLWLHGHSFEVQRKPLGVILIVAAGNYPLFLPAVQMLQALAAGNAVVIKPAEGASRPIAKFIDLIADCGIPADLIQLLPETPNAAREAARVGVDKAIFTGSSHNGRDFLALLAEQNTPSVMELSGADTVFVRADADIALAAQAIRFGLRLNGGNTCMAPHAIVVHQSVAAELTAALKSEGVAAGAIFPVRDDAEALEVASVDEHGLGAAIFSRDEEAARRLAQQLTTGFVTINDIIVPTADPRLPFGGVRASGFGVTRGAEGLLEMTHPQAIAVRRSRFLPHFEAPSPNDAKFFSAFASLVHGRGFGRRWRALLDLIQAGRGRRQNARKLS